MRTMKCLAVAEPLRGMYLKATAFMSLSWPMGWERVTNVSNELRCRNQARDKALRILGVMQHQALDFPDNSMDSVPLIDVVQALEPIIDQVQPERIYTHHHGDLNVDHRVTHQAVMTACRPMPGISVREILTFEVMSSTEWATPSVAPFMPNFLCRYKRLYV